MEVILKQRIYSASKGTIRIVKKINPELCVDTLKIARQTSLGANEKNDCVVRAFMAALDISYASAHSFVKKYLNRRDREGTFTSSYIQNVLGKVKNGKKIQMYGVSPTHDYLIGYYIKKAKVITNPRYKVKRPYTLSSFIESHPTGRYVVIVNHHAVAVVDGKLYGNTREGSKEIKRRVHFVVECK